MPKRLKDRQNEMADRQVPMTWRRPVARQLTTDETARAPIVPELPMPPTPTATLSRAHPPEFGATELSTAELNRAYAASGICEVGLVSIGETGLVQVVGSFDLNQAVFKVNSAIFGFNSEDPPIFKTDPREWFTLKPEQAVRIINAAGKPVMTRRPDVVVETAIGSLALLLNELHVLGIFPPSAPGTKSDRAYARRLEKAARKVRNLLQMPEGASLLADWGALSQTEEGLTELANVARLSVNALQAQARRRRSRSGLSARQKFVCDDLSSCFENLFQWPAGVSRSSKSGSPEGPFIRFATAFFDEIGLKVPAETIARDLRR
jgi:hypothetical protein